jgi:hypothetical protein
MKTHLSLVFLIILSDPTIGQINLNAGNDTAVCINTWGFDTLEIGGNPTASGGVEPYIYSWSTNYKIGSHTYGASNFLDDSTVSNPKIVNPTDDFLKFKLIVTDNLGSIAEDSITIRFSIFYYLAFECIYIINLGDTVSLFGTMGQGIGPLSYTWSPNYNISDTAIASPRAWPDTSTYYHVYATDSIGCISEPQTCSVIIKSTGISQIKNNLIKSIVFPNPISENSTILLDEDIIEKLTLQIINSNGQTVLFDNFSSNAYIIGNKIHRDGFYVYVIKNGPKIVSYGQFIKN